MRRTPTVLISLGLISLLALFGCSNNPSAPGGGTANTLTQGHGRLGNSDFEMIVPATTSSGRNLDGPFLLRGTNVHYDDSLATLVADLTVVNQSQRSFPEPVTLTFLNLIPDSVSVKNPDNGINGAGAAINFAFANTDSLWTAGEESLPRTVEFSVPNGVSVGFTARLTVGTPVAFGTISGRVWNDTNQNGIIDGGETGIPGVRIRISRFSSSNSPGIVRDDDNGDDDHDGDHDGDDDGDDDNNGGGGNNGGSLPSVVTNAEGNFIFAHVPAGAYVVTKALSADTGLTPTTPLRIYVLLTETNGVVNNFTDANFGCVSTTP